MMSTFNYEGSFMSCGIFYEICKEILVFCKLVLLSLLPRESRLEGGVNRANLKFTNLITTTSRVSVRNRNESEREGAKQIVSE
jgi:hypothetical protein